MTVAQDKRIAELEAEIVARDYRIAHLESLIGSQPAQHLMVREVTPRVDMPTGAELTRLYAIVTAKWPRLAHPTPDRGVQLFGSAFAYLSSAVSHNEKRSQYSAGMWVDRCEQWLRARARPSEMSWAAIATAAACLGFGYSGFDQPAFSWNLWASEGSHRLPSPQSWRGILAGEPLRAPMPFTPPRVAMQERVVIVAGQGDGRPVNTW